MSSWRCELKYFSSHIHEDVKLKPIVDYYIFLYLSHSVLRLVLTLQISRVIEMLIFGLGWVIGITPYV